MRILMFLSVGIFTASAAFASVIDSDPYPCSALAFALRPISESVVANSLAMQSRVEDLLKAEIENTTDQCTFSFSAIQVSQSAPGVTPVSIANVTIRSSGEYSQMSFELGEGANGLSSKLLSFCSVSRSGGSCE